MAQSLLSPLEITREFLDILHSEMSITKNMDHQYTPKFANSGIALAGKIGSTLNIRKPNQYTVRDGWSMQLQDITEQSVPLTINTVKGIDLEFADSELSLTISDFKERYIEPAAKRLAAEVDRISGAYALAQTYNQVGTVGTQPNAATMFLDAKRKLKENLIPGGVRPNCIISPHTEATAVGSFTNVFNPMADISKQWKEGVMSNAFGLDWYTSETLSSHTNGSRNADTATVAKAALSGAGQTSIAVANAGSLQWNAGDLFTIAGVYAVNPETKTRMGSLMSFCVAEAVTASTTAVIKITVPLYTSGALQNIDISSMANTGAVLVNTSGTASLTYENDLVYSSKAFAFAVAELEKPRGMDMSEVVTDDGFSMRFVRGFDINNSRQLSRMDIFFGLAALRPEWSTRIIGYGV